MFATGAQAQVECTGNGPYEVPFDWALKPSGLAAGTNFRLLFLTSTGRNATATDIATYNTFVQTRAKAGHSAITDSCGNRFKVVGSTSTVDARDNTATTGTGEAIYWLNGAKVADNYADFYDRSWDSYSGKAETGASKSTPGLGIFTGSNFNGTKHTSQYLGSGSTVRIGRLNVRVPFSQHAIHHSFSTSFYALSPIFTVGAEPDATLSLSLGSTSGNEGDSGNSDVTVTISLSPTRSEATVFNFCVKDTGTATFRNASGGKAADFNVVNFFGGTNLSMNAQNCHSYTIGSNSGSSQVKLRIFGDTTPEGNETAILELRNPPSGVAVSSTAGTATYTINNDDGARPTITISGGNAVTEGTGAQFTVNASTAPSAALTVQLDVSDDDTSDFVASGNEGRKTVTIAANATSATYTVNTQADSTDEPNGEVTVEVVEADGYTVGSMSSAMVTVNDDDGTTPTNNAPTVANSIPDRTATTGTAFSYAFPANTFADADNDSLTYSATKPDGSVLPSWLSFTPGTRTFSGTPGSGDTGTVSVKVTASDGNGGTVSDTFDIAVSAPANNAPTVANSIPNRTATTGTAFSYQFPANTFADADNDGLTYTATKPDGSALPTWLTFTPGTRTFSGTPGSGDTGTVSVKVTASDGNGGTVSDTFDIAVSAPATSNIQVTASAVWSSVPEGHRLQFDVTATPAPAQDLSVNVTVSDANGVVRNRLPTTVRIPKTDGGPGARFRSTGGFALYTKAGKQGTVKLTVNGGSGYKVGNPKSAATRVTTDLPTLSLSLGSTSGVEGDSGSRYVDVNLGLSRTRSAATGFNLCVKDAGTATFRTDSGSNVRDFDLVHAGSDTGLTLDADNCHRYIVDRDSSSSRVRLRIFGDAAAEGDETAVLEVRDAPSVVKVSPATATYTIANDDSVPAPAKPAGFTATAGDTEVALSWTDPANSNITVWQYRQKSGSGSFGAWTDIPGSTASTTGHTVTDLANGTAYGFQVRARAGTTDGAASDARSATPTAGTPGLVIEPVLLTVPEGATASYTVKLASRPTGTVTVNIASDNADVTVSPAPLTFHASGGAKLWSTAQAVTVSAGHDNDAVDDAATLTHTASGGGYGAVSGTVSVNVDDDETPATPTLSVAIAPASANEGASGSRTYATATFRLDPVRSTATSFKACLKNTGTAARGATADYRFVNLGKDTSLSLANECHTATIPANRASHQVRLLIRGDGALEPDETVVVELRDAPQGVAISTGTATYTIVNDDTDPNACASARLRADVEEYAGETWRDSPTHVSRWSRVMAAFGHDNGYTPMPSTEAQTHADRGWTRWVPVVTALECLEGAIPTDPAVTVTGGSAVTEGGDAVFTVSANPAPTANLQVTLTVADDATGDFLDTGDEGTKTVTIPGGQNAATLTVSTRDDSADEPDGSVTATVAGGNGYRVGSPSQGTVAVSDNDATPPATPVVSIAGGDAIEEGGTARFTLTASPAPAGSIAVGVQVTQTGAFAGSGQLGTRTVAIGTSGTAVLDVATVNDTTVEADGSIAAAVRTGTGYTPHGTNASASVAVADNDIPPVVRIAAGNAITEGGTAEFTLTATPAPASALTVNVRVKNTNIGVGSGQGGTRTVSVGTDGTAVLGVATVNDNNDWPDGSVHAAVRSGTGYTVAAAPDHAATVSVADDDVAAGVPTLSVNDVTVDENNRACVRGYVSCITFTVTLSHMPADLKRSIGFLYYTRESSPVSARGYSSPRDFYHAEGTLRFRPGGPLTQSITVWLADDNIAEGPETFELVIAYPSGGAAIADGVGVGTIVNDDPMPAAWLARFGRTAAEQALDGIAGRMAADRTPGLKATVAGQALGAGHAAETAGMTPTERRAAKAERDAELAMAELARAIVAERHGDGMDGGPGGQSLAAQSRSMTAKEAMLGTRFSLTGQRDGAGGTLAFWGRAAQSAFDGREGTFALDGEATTAMLGADYARDRWLVGMALMQTSGEGGYADSGSGPQACPDDMDAETRAVLCNGAVREGDGDVEASLTAAVPYAALQASERLKLWGAAGYGTGEVTLKPEVGGTLKSDLSWTMAAAGLRGDVIAPPAEGSGPALAVTSDALWARTSSDRTHDLAASESDVTRLRLGLEGSWRVALEGGGTVVPKLEVGARHDGGDAETGFGVELGGGVAWTDPALGLTLDLSGRTLVAHEDGDLKDRGFSASVSWDPAPETARGPSLSMRQAFGGEAQGGLDALFATDPLADRTGSEAASRWEAEAAWGLPVFGGRWTYQRHTLDSGANSVRFAQSCSSACVRSRRRRWNGSTRPARAVT